MTMPRWPQALALAPDKLDASQRRDLMAYYLATVDAAFKSRLAALKDLRKQRSALGRPGGRDHGDEGAVQPSADLPAQARRL